jgi:hypothetical protein
MECVSKLQQYCLEVWGQVTERRTYCFVCMYDDDGGDERDVQSSRPQLRSPLPRQTLEVVGQEQVPPS